MMKFAMFLTCTFVSLNVLFSQNSRGEFVSLFDGKSLNGWTASEENSNSFLIEDGQLVCRGGRAHIFYTGPIGEANFKNFELKMRIKTTASSNSGVYFHTRYQKAGWPQTGFEAQVNSRHSDPRKTGSLYGIVNVWAPEKVEDPFLSKVDKNGEVFILQPNAPSTDGAWFDYYIKVQDKSIVIKVDGMTTVDWTQPANWPNDRRIGSGTVGMQAHDPSCNVFYKDIEIKILD